MRITPSSNWSLIASAAHRVVTWTVSIRKTTSLGDSLSSGTWVDCTKYLIDIPEISQQTEFELGQFSADAISLQGSNIDWWEANVFNASATEYIEIKITAALSLGSLSASDTLYAFSGFVDKMGVRYSEKEDMLYFSAFTAEEIGSRLSAQNIVTQYVDQDAAGTGSAGLFLPRIPGIYVTNAGIGSYELQLGAHTLSFDAGALSLDGGTPVSLAAGTNTLSNTDDTQRIEVYAYTGQLPSYATEETIIVDTYGDTLPKNQYYGISARNMIQKCYEEIGITDITFDTLKINSYDSTRRLSFYDVPTINTSITTGYYNGIAHDGTDFWVATGNRIYKKDGVTGAYTIKVTLTSTYIIKRLLYNARNNHLWVLYDSGSPTQSLYNRVRVYDIGDDILSNELSISAGAGGQAFTMSAEILDYNYSGASYKYGLMAVTDAINPGDTEFIYISKSGSNLTENSLRTIAGSELPLDVSVWISSSNIYFGIKDSTNGYVRKFHVNGSGSFVDDGILNVANPVYYDANLKNAGSGAYNYADDKLYFWQGTDIYSWTPASGTAAVSIKSNVGAAVMMSDKSSLVMASMTVTSDEPYYRLYTIASGSALKVSSTEQVKVKGGGMFGYDGSYFYGITQEGYIWQYAAVINLYINREMTDYSSLSVRDMYTKVLQGFNLLGKISSRKKGFVYRRGDSAGTIQTTGNTIALNISNIVNYTKTQNSFAPYDIVLLSNGSRQATYDGSDFNKETFADARRLEITNEMIPANIFNDVLVYMFNFYKTAHDTYLFELNTAQMEYEAMDAATPSLADRRAAISGSTGLIIGQAISKSGAIRLDVLI